MFDLTTATREQLEDHIVEECTEMCVGDPQVLADLDVATDDELRTHIADTHAYYAQQAAEARHRHGRAPISQG